MQMHFSMCWLEIFLWCPCPHLCSVFSQELPGLCFCVVNECSLADMSQAALAGVAREYGLFQAGASCVPVVGAPVPSQHSTAGISGGPSAGWHIGTV